MHGNPQNGPWCYGTGERNPTCASLPYSFLENKRGEKENELSDHLLESFENTYSPNPIIINSSSNIAYDLYDVLSIAVKYLLNME